MGDSNPAVVFHGRVCGNTIVLDEQTRLPQGAAVTVRVESILPEPGTWEAVSQLFATVKAPPGFDATKISREDLYD